LAEIEARRTAAAHVGAFTRIRQAGVSAFNSIGTTMTRLRYGAQLIATTFVVSFGLVAWQLSKLLGGFAEFEQRMRKATSVTKYTEDEFKAMSKEAETAAKKWGTPARDAADAFLFLGRAGLTSAQQLAAMPPIVAASKAMMEDLEETAEGTVNIMNAFNMSFDKTPHVVDMMTEAVNSSTMNLHEFLVSLSYAAKPAAAFNNTMQDVAAMIGIAANAGIRGSKAGTALRYTLTQLSSPTAAMKRSIRELHLRIYDTSGAMIPLVDILQQLQDKLAGAGEQTRNYTLKTLFGQRALSTMIALFEKGAVGIKAYSDQIAKAAGVTETTAQKQMAAMKSQLEKLRETWDALKRHIVQSFAPDIVRTIKIIISYVDDWTTAIDNNQKRVRSFAKEVVGFFIAFAKITAGAAAFALLARVLGGIVMILQAILSPLGVILVAILAVQTAWRTNFLKMRDIGEWVFRFLKDDALSFFSTLINGSFAAISYVINQIARLGQKWNIGGLAGNIKLATTFTPEGAGAAGYQTELKRLLGVNPADEAKRLLAADRKFYEDMKDLAMEAIPQEEYLKRLVQMVKNSQEAISTNTAQFTIQGIIDTTRPATKVLKDFFVTTGEAFADTFKMDIDFIINKFREMIPDELLRALRELQNLWRDVASGKTVGGAVMGLQMGYKAPAMRGTLHAPGLLSLDTDAWVRAHANLIGRIRILYKDFLDAYADDWDAALGKVTDGFKTQIDVIADMFQSIQTGWSDALDNLMKQGSSFIDFMDSFFQSILTGFRRMVAEMLSIQMFETVFGKGTQSRETTEAGAGLWGNIAKGFMYMIGMKKEWGGGITIPTTTSPSLGQPNGLDMEDLTSNWGGGTQKIAPPVAIHLHNESGMELSARQMKKPLFDGRQWIVNVVMEESTTNPRFREILAGGT
jgi:TP901 family phage tail tape measure protein